MNMYDEVPKNDLSSDFFRDVSNEFSQGDHDWMDDIHDELSSDNEHYNEISVLLDAVRMSEGRNEPVSTPPYGQKYDDITLKKILDEALINKLPEIKEYKSKGYNTIAIDRLNIEILKGKLEGISAEGPIISLLQPVKNFLAMMPLDDEIPDDHADMTRPVNILVATILESLDVNDTIFKLYFPEWNKGVNKRRIETGSKLLAIAMESKPEQLGESVSAEKKDRERSEKVQKELKIKNLLYSDSQILSGENVKFKKLQQSLQAADRVTRTRFAGSLAWKSARIVTTARETREYALKKRLSQVDIHEKNITQSAHWMLNFNQYAQHLRAVDGELKENIQQGNPFINAVIKQPSVPSATDRFIRTFLPVADALAQFSVQMQRYKNRIEPPEEVKINKPDGWKASGGRKINALYHGIEYLTQTGANMATETLFKTVPRRKRRAYSKNGHHIFKNTSLSLLDVVLQIQRRVRQLPSSAGDLQEAVEQYHRVSKAVRRQDSEPGLSQALDAALDDEAKNWLEMEQQSRNKLQELLAPVVTLAQDKWAQDFYFELSEEFNASLRDSTMTVDKKDIRAFHKVLNESVDALSILARDISNATEPLAGEGYSGRKELESRITTWGMRLNTLEGRINVGMTKISGSPTDNFSRGGMLARGMAEWAQDLKKLLLKNCNPEEKEAVTAQFNRLLMMVLDENRTHFAKKSDPEAEGFMKRFRLALTQVSENTLAYPPTPEEILATSRSIPEDIQRWAENRVVTGAVSAAFYQVIRFIANTTFLPIKATIRTGRTAWTSYRGARAITKGTRLGQGQATEKQNQYLSQMISKNSLRFILSLSPATGYGIAVAITAEHVNKEGFKKFKKTAVNNLLIDLAIRGGVEGINLEVNRITQSVNEMIMALVNNDAPSCSLVDSTETSEIENSVPLKRARRDISDGDVKGKTEKIDKTLVATARQECEDEIKAGNPLWKDFKRVWDDLDMDIKTKINNAASEPGLHQEKNVFVTGAVNVRNVLSEDKHRIERSLDDSPLNEKESRQKRALIHSLEEKISQIDYYLINLNGILSLTNDIDSWDFINSVRGLMRDKNATASDIANAFKVQAVKLITDSQNKPEMSASLAIRFYDVIMSSTSDDTENLRFAMQQYVKIRMYFLCNYLSLDTTSMPLVSRFINRNNFIKYEEFQQSSLDSLLLRYRVTFGTQSNAYSFKDIQQDLKSYAISDPTFYKLLNDYVNYDYIHDAKRSAVQVLACEFKDVFDSPTTVSQEIKSIKTYDFTRTSGPRYGVGVVSSAHKNKLQGDIKIVMLSSGEKFIISTLAGKLVILRYHPDIDAKIENVKGPDDFRGVIEFLYGSSSSFEGEEDLLKQDSTYRSLFFTKIEVGVKCEEGGLKGKSITDVATSYFSEIFKKVAIDIRESGNGTLINEIGKLIPFYAVIMRRIADPEYNPTAADMAIDIVSVTVPVAVNGLKLSVIAISKITSLLRGAMTQIKQSGKVLKGVKLYSEAFSLAAPLIIKEFPSLKTSIVSLSLLSSEVLSPVPVFSPVNYVEKKTYQRIKHLRALSKVTPVDDGMTGVINKQSKMEPPSGQHKKIPFGSHYDIEFHFADEVIGEPLEAAKKQFRVDLKPVNSKLSSFAGNPAGMCDQAAETVLKQLDTKGYQTRVVGVLVYKNAGDTTPLNHYAVIACKGDVHLVVDATFDQFKAPMSRNGEVLITSWEDWQRQLTGADKLNKQSVFIKEYNSLGDARNDIAFTDGNPYISSKYISDPNFEPIHVTDLFLRQMGRLHHNNIEMLMQDGMLKKLSVVDKDLSAARDKLEKLNNERLALIRGGKEIPDNLVDNISKAKIKISELEELKLLPDKISNYQYFLGNDLLSEPIKTPYASPVNSQLYRHLEVTDNTKNLNVDQIESVTPQGLAMIDNCYYLVADGKYFLITLHAGSMTQGNIMINKREVEIEFKRFFWEMSDTRVMPRDSSVSNVFETSADVVNDVTGKFLIANTYKDFVEKHGFSEEAIDNSRGRKGSSAKSKHQNRMVLKGMNSVEFGWVDLSADNSLRIRLDCNTPHNNFSNQKYASISIRDKKGEIRYNKDISGDDKSKLDITEKLLPGEKLEIFHREPSRVTRTNVTSDRPEQRKYNHTFLRTEGGLEKVGSDSPELYWRDDNKNDFAVLNVDVDNNVVKMDVINKNPTPQFEDGQYVTVRMFNWGKDGSTYTETDGVMLAKGRVDAGHHEFPISSGDRLCIYNNNDSHQVTASSEIQDVFNEKQLFNTFRLVDDKLINTRQEIILSGENDRTFATLTFDNDKQNLDISFSSINNMVHSGYAGLQYAKITITHPEILLYQTEIHGDFKKNENIHLSLKEGCEIRIYHAEHKSRLIMKGGKIDSTYNIQRFKWTKNGLEQI